MTGDAHAIEVSMHHFSSLARGRALQRRSTHAAATAVAAFIASLAPLPALAGGEQSLEKVEVTGSKTNLVGVADSANVGTVTQKQLEARTVYRPGELLESAPGLVVSQHSGEGKANQFYLRGFNLDHGTDLRTTVDGMNWRPACSTGRAPTTRARATSLRPAR